MSPKAQVPFSDTLPEQMMRLLSAVTKFKDLLSVLVSKTSFQGTILAKYAADNLDAKKAIILGDNSSDYANGLSSSL